jgi:metal-responsive CopG/Arc/MetJ family transcriptional regulator
MTIDDRLLKLVDKMSLAQKTSRSAFIRVALEAEIRRQRVTKVDTGHQRNRRNEVHEEAKT